MRGIYILMGIMTVAWLLILGESYIFFAVIRPIGPPLHSSPLVSSVLKVGGTAALAVIWFVVMLSLTEIYVRSRLKRTPT